MSQEINNSAAISLTYDEFKSQYLEYQSKLDKLRKNGTDRIKVLENENRKIKNNRILADDVKKSLIEKNKDAEIFAKICQISSLDDAKKHL